MALKILFILILIAPLSLWGFSSESITQYQEIAAQKNLATSPEWMSLGHYRKSLLGNIESPFRGKIFILEDGYKNLLNNVASSLARLG